MTLACPVCGRPLSPAARTLRCERGHSYDLSKHNYVNLLMSNASSSRRHGDDRRMVAARSAFLDAGYYAPLRDELCRMAVKYAAGETALLDVGCGEGYYTAALRESLARAGRGCDAAGIDISRTALAAASRRDPSLTLAVASVSALPVADGGCDMLVNIFAPWDDGEFCRVLRPGGVAIKALPLERHLFGLKAAVYERPYENPPPDFAPEGFDILERRDIFADITLTRPDMIEALFMMTPYYYKTSQADQEKLRGLDRLETQLAFGVFALRRRL